MRIQLVSDLHVEFYPEDGRHLIATMNPEGVDVLVIAGDFHPLSKPLRAQGAMEQIVSKYREVIYVPGNHDYWGCSPEVVRKLMKVWQAQWPNLHVPETGKVVELGGYRFLGDTMWFPEVEDIRLCRRGWPDIERITDCEPYFYEHNAAFRKFLIDECREGDIVVTHHMPSNGSVAPRWRGNPTNCFFVSDMEDVIEAKRPMLWFHGHTHDQFDYFCHATRIVCNPQGYPGENYVQRRVNPVYIDLDNR